MNPNEILLIGLKRKVAAVARRDGRILWSTVIPGGMGQGFVTILSDGARVFAYTNGSLHCLDLQNGRLLWSNDLPGYGYGIGSLALPGLANAPDSTTVAALVAAEQASASAANAAA